MMYQVKWSNKNVFKLILVQFYLSFFNKTDRYISGIRNNSSDHQKFVIKENGSDPI